MIHSNETSDACVRAAQDVVDRNRVRDLDATLAQLVEGAVALVPAAGAGSIVRLRDGTVLSRASCGAPVDELDGAQLELAQGPSIDAARGGRERATVVAHDLAGADADRWDRFAPLAVRSGFRSVVSVDLVMRPKGPVSTLTLYGVAPSAFDEGASAAVTAFGLYAAGVLHGADDIQNLSRALESRDVIGQAKGVLMERFALDDEQAFRMLVSSSQETNIKLLTVAQWLVGESRSSAKGGTGAGPGAEATSSVALPDTWAGTTEA